MENPELVYPPESRETSRITVFSEGWHTGVVLKSEDVSHAEWYDDLDFEQSEYLELSWGDEALFRSEKLTPWLIFSALFLPTVTVIRVAAVRQKPAKHYAKQLLRTYDITRDQLGALLCAVVDSIRREKVSSELMCLGKGAREQEVYFRGRERYFISRSCNRWTALLLRKAGFEVHAIFAPALFEQLDAKYPSLEFAESVACNTTPVRHS